jgi:hypothetical protein
MNTYLRTPNEKRRYRIMPIRVRIKKARAQNLPE